MAMILDPLMSRIIDIVINMAKDEVMMVRGINKELKRLEEKLNMIKEILNDAQKKGPNDNAVAIWLNKLRDIMYDADDIIDECETRAIKHMELQQKIGSAYSMVRCCYPSHLSCLQRIAFHHEIGNKIKGVNARLAYICKEKSDLSLTRLISHEDSIVSRENRVIPKTSPVYSEFDVVGIEKNVNILVDMLLDKNQPKNAMFAITGMGGIGKTTLAQAIYNNERIQSEFDEKIWLCLSQNFSDVDLMKQLIRSARGSPGEAQECAELAPLVLESVKDKNFLLVLDDVWDAWFWVNTLQPALQRGTVGSRILITTRNELIARQMGAIHIHSVNLLSDDDGWIILSKTVFGRESIEESVKDIGKKIVEKCHGLPIAIKTIAGILRTKDVTAKEWEKVLDNEVWSSKDIPNRILPALYLSYQDLPSHLKQCFTYCSLFPKDWVLLRRFVAQFWISEGFVSGRGHSSLEEIAEDYFRELVKRCLFKIDPYYYDEYGCTMHDLVREMAISLANGECYCGNLEGLVNTSTKPRRISLVDDAIKMIPKAINVHGILRTIICQIPQLENIPEDLFYKLKRLRALCLSDTQIKALPNSIGNLTFLRYLDISRTRIRELPKSVAFLVNLQFLIIQNCEHLHNLHSGIVMLHKLRSLDLLNTMLRNMPLGIRSLKDLRVLKGFVAANEDNKSNMEELKSLSELTRIILYHLERVRSGNEAKGAALRDMPHLTHAELHCDDGVVDPKEEDKERIEQVFEELCPPSCIEKLEINGFFGQESPSWLTYLPNLRRLDLIRCKSFQHLPSLGQLPQLNYLGIKGATSIVNVGPEFFRGSTKGGFPKLEKMHIRNMPNWESWQLTEWLANEETPLLPCFKELTLEGCPKLESIPGCLFRHATSLEELYIYEANCLSTLTDFSASIKKAQIWNCPRLEAISNLHKLADLNLKKCPKLKKMDNLSSLKHLSLLDEKMEDLPDWLQGITTQLQRLELRISPELLRRCVHRDGPEWTKIIKHISHVEGFAHGSVEEFSYIKSSNYFHSNLTDA